MVIVRPGAIDGAPPRGRSKAEDGGGGTFLPREEWAQAQGMKVATARLRHRRSRRQPTLGQIPPSEGPYGALGRTEVVMETVAAMCDRGRLAA
jgi:hypothetical protein